MRKFNPALLSLLVSGLLIASACSRSPLSVRLDYLSHENLASYHVRTPDPRLYNPIIGERLVISWVLPEDQLAAGDITLSVNIRLHDRSAITEEVPVCQATGSFSYTLINDAYFDTKGILSYRAKLIQGDCVLDEWRHQIWAELIELDVCDTDYDEGMSPVEEYDGDDKEAKEGVDYDPATDI